MKNYENDKRSLTLAELEKFLYEYYGIYSNDGFYERGCNVNGKWFSIETVLQIVSDKI